MKRFWKWVVDHKISTIQKWQSVVMHLDRDQLQEQHLKPISGSCDELGRKKIFFQEEENSTILEDENKDYRSSISLQDLDIENESESIDFEEFFEDSSIAIESALEKKYRSSISNQKKLSIAIESLTSIRKMEDDFNSEFDDQPPSSLIVKHRDPIVVSQMDLTNDTAPKTKDRQILKCRELSLVSTGSSSHENKKEKWNERKKKMSLQFMGLCKTEVESSLSTHCYIETLPSLTSAQIHLIRNIWRQVYLTKGPTVIGSTLMHGIFFKSKKIKDQFFKCPFPDQFPNRDSFNKAHAKAVGEMLDKIVDNLENLKSISGYLFSFGAMHANLARQQVPKEIWNLMAETFIDCTLDWGDKKGRTEASRKAWAFIISFAVGKIKKGYLHERRQLAYHERSSAAASFQTISTSSLPLSLPTIRFWESAEEPDSHV